MEKSSIDRKRRVSSYSSHDLRSFESRKLSRCGKFFRVERRAQHQDKSARVQLLADEKLKLKKTRRCRLLLLSLTLGKPCVAYCCTIGICCECKPVLDIPIALYRPIDFRLVLIAFPVSGGPLASRIRKSKREKVIFAIFPFYRSR